MDQRLDGGYRHWRKDVRNSLLPGLVYSFVANGERALSPKGFIHRCLDKLAADAVNVTHCLPAREGELIWADAYDTAVRLVQFMNCLGPLSRCINADEPEPRESCQQWARNVTQRIGYEILIAVSLVFASEPGWLPRPALTHNQ